MTGFFKNLFLYSAGHTYSNLSRLFLRLFTGIMFLQLCIRQMLNFDENVILSSPANVSDLLFNFQPGYPVMFIGIFVFMLLSGPGKISLDYIIAAHFTESPADEAVVDNA